MALSEKSPDSESGELMMVLADSNSVRALAKSPFFQYATPSKPWLMAV
jgi:hypothetical protein